MGILPVDRILLLQPPSPPYSNVMRDYAGGYGVAFSTSRSDYGHAGGSTPYISLLYTAAILEELGYDVSIIDCQAEQLSASESLHRIEQLNPRIVISVVSLPSLAGDLAFLDMMRVRLSNVDILAIGTVCKLLYAEVLNGDVVTAAVRGDAEVVVPPLVAAILESSDLSSVPGIAYGEHKTPDSEPLKSLDELPMPLYHKLPMDCYREPSWGQDVKYMAILDGRGCPHSCRSYCPYPFGFGKRLLLRSPELVVDEIQYLHEAFATEAFIFRNQTFTMNKHHVQGICDEILRRDLRIRWLCETRLDSVDVGMLKTMKQAGCERIHYGLESGDPEVFTAVGKPGCDLDNLGRLIEATKKVGILVKVNVVIGLPGESWRTVHHTIQTIRQLKPDVVMAAIITPYPGTEIYEDAVRRGLLISKDWSGFSGFAPIMKTDHLTSEDLMVAQRMVAQCLDAKTLPARLLRKARRLAGGVLQQLSAERGINS